jgi:hypothetical protein
MVIELDFNGISSPVKRADLQNQLPAVKEAKPIRYNVALRVF